MVESRPLELPQLGDGQEEARLVEWRVGPGDGIAEGEVAAVVETEKTTVEIPAEVSGTVLDLLVQQGDLVPVGSVLAIVQPAEPEPASSIGSVTAQRLERELDIDLQTLLTTGDSPSGSALPDHSELRRHIENARSHLRQIRSRVDEDLSRAEEPLAQALEDLETTLEALHRTEAELRDQRREVVRLHRRQESILRRYQELFAFAPDGYLVTAPDGTIREINRAGLELLGEEAGEEMVGRKLEDLIDPARREPFRARLKALLEGRASRIQDWQLRLKSLRPGAIPFEAELTVEPILESEGEGVAELRWLVRDVTERRLAEEALRAAMVRHTALLEAAVDGIISINERGIIQSINPAVERIFGYREEELVGENVKILMPSPDRDRHDDYLRRYQETGERKIIGIGREVQGRRQDGTVFLLDLAVSEMHIGDQVGYVGILRDITERKAIERALKEERDFAESLVDTARAIVLVLDTEGRIVRFNRYLEELTGYSLEELRGEDWFSTLLPERDHQPIRELYQRSMGGESVDGNINAILTRDGQEREIEWYDTTLKDADGLKTGILAVGLDVTERIRLENSFRQAQKMEAVGRLAGGVAHDFNTLLGSIIGYSEMLLERLPEGSPLERPVRQIHRGANRGAALTRQLLAFSRRQVVTPQNLDLNALLEGMEDMICRLIGEDIRLHQNLHPELGAVRADAGQMEQVIMNLAVNAVDAMPQGGSLTLHTFRADREEVARIRGADVDEGSYVVLTVEDTGHGIAEDVLGHIFDPFFTTKERGKGTGLGLSTVYGIVQQSGGGIAVESTVGEGTRFTIYLPDSPGEATAPVESAPRRAATAAAGGSEVILLVEDDEMFLELLGEVLTEAGYTVLSSADPEQALDLVTEHGAPPQILISDMVMPGMSGNQLAGQLLEIYPDTRVVLMSGYTEEALEVRGADTTGVHFIQKPFSPHELVERVRAILDSDEDG